jgi:SAM-dependent methyltransferase
MELTEPTARFDRGYREGTPPWVIDEPQPAVVGLERDGACRGSVLDIGCGTGEHTVFLADRGYDVLGADASPAALAWARERAEARGVATRFTQVDALDPTELREHGGFDTILDSALFHVFGEDDQARYAEALRGLCAPGAVLHLLALARADGPAFGPVITQSAIRRAFDRPGWAVQAILSTTYGGVVSEHQVEAIGQPAGTRVDVPAWLARIHRVDG